MTKTSSYGWIISHDFIGDDERVGTSGPRNIDGQLLDRLLAGEGHRFNMFDDDGVLYYRGRLVGPIGGGEGEYSDRPLLDFGLPNAGCTEIRFPFQIGWDADA